MARLVNVAVPPAQVVHDLTDDIDGRLCTPEEIQRMLLGVSLDLLNRIEGGGTRSTHVRGADGVLYFAIAVERVDEQLSDINTVMATQALIDTQFRAHREMEAHLEGHRNVVSRLAELPPSRRPTRKRRYSI